MSHDTRGVANYHETEARLAEAEIRRGERPIYRLPAIVRNGGFHPLPMPSVTPEQARAGGWELFASLTDLVNVIAERGLMSDLVVAHAWIEARSTVRRVSKIEAVAASEPADGSDPQRASETTAVEAHRNNATSPGA